MSDEVRANMFKAFFTTKKDGTGLGLLSCRRILDNHKSYIRVETAPGQGTTFTLYFPLATVRAAAEVEREPPQGAGQRVLIVMEKASTLSLVSDTLRSNGYSVSAAQSGTAALQEIESYGLPELVLLEEEMSLMTGVRTLSALLDRHYEGPVIMFVRAGGVARSTTCRRSSASASSRSRSNRRRCSKRWPRRSPGTAQRTRTERSRSDS